ncbi:MAG: poly(R)-hydroxyalkanoic acid synthase subunit PhaE [Bacteroidota bacterium]
MANQFDAFFEGQKKAFDFWSDTSKKIMGNLTEPFEEKTEKEDFLSSWFASQKKIWEGAMMFDDLKKVYDKTPEKLGEWAKLQTEFAQGWMEFYTKNAERLGVKLPTVNGTAPSDFFSRTPKEWSEWVEQANQWWQDKLMMKLPFPQDFHFKNFNELYQNMYQLWGPMQRMVEHGIDNWKAIDVFIKPEEYQKIIAKFVGMKPITDVSAMLGQVNEMFSQSAGWMEDFAAGTKDIQAQWKMMGENMGAWTPGHALQVVLSLNETLQEGMDSMYNVAGRNKEVEMARMIKDIQFMYTAFVLRTAEMQGKVMEVGRYALPDTIRFFSEKRKEGKELPDFESFFNEYVNILEKYMIEVFESKEYSLMQNEVAKAGVTVKSKMDQLVELAFSDFPFLMKSHADEIAIENRALRKKIRSLEQRMTALEAADSNHTPATPGNGAADELLSGIGRASAAQKDNLQQIRGIGPKLEVMLNSLGIFTFEQLSKMTKKHYEMMDELLDAFQGRGFRDEWAKQAKTLFSNKNHNEKS